MNIRPALHSDASLIIQAHIRSIRELCARDYSPEQIAAWSGRDFKVARWCESMDRDHVWVVEGNGTICGFGHMSFPNPGEAYIAGLYFTPEAKGLGLGRKMVDLMLKRARENSVTSIKLDATKTALGFYLSMGFKILEKSFVRMADQQIDCVKMLRLL